MLMIDDIIDEIKTEFAYATYKFPEWPTDPIHAAMVVAEESGELMKAVLQQCYEPHKTSMDEVRMEAIQTATTAIRFLISLNNYKFDKSEQHVQNN